MGETLYYASIWLSLAVLATILSIWFRIATALAEILVGALAPLIVVSLLNGNMGIDEPWIKFLAGAGAILLTFLAGAEIDPVVFKLKWKEASAIGFLSFLGPFLGCTAVAYYFLKWDVRASWLAGVALSTTSVAVVYAVMLEFGLNKTEYGKTILAACFITDLGTVLALGLIFSPFSYKSLCFLIPTLGILFVLPYITTRFFARFGGRPSEIEAKYLLMVLFILGALAMWAGSEAVLPAYLIGMVLAGSVGRDHVLVRRLRTLTLGLLTPFYFLRAGSLISLPTLAAAPMIFIMLLLGKMATKYVFVYPTTKIFGHSSKDGMYTTLLMSTGLTFGSISAIFGLTNDIIDKNQYSFLVAAVIASAVVPTLIANKFYLPRHLLSKAETEVPPALSTEPHIIPVPKRGDS